jgi:hypothetical protein
MLQSQTTYFITKALYVGMLFLEVASKAKPKNGSHLQDRPPHPNASASAVT